MTFPSLPKLLWHRKLDAGWFESYRKSNPCIDVPGNLHLHIPLTIIAAVLISFTVGVVVPLFGYLALALFVLCVLVVFFAMNLTVAEIALVALLLVVPLMSLLITLPLLVIALSRVFILISSSIVSNYLQFAVRRCQQPERDFYFAVYESGGELSEEKRLELLDRITGPPRHVDIRRNILANTYRNLEQANCDQQNTRRGLYSLSVSITSVVLAIVLVTSRNWSPSFLLLVSGILITQIVAGVGCRKYQCEQRVKEETQFAIRLWHADSKLTNQAALSLALYFVIAVAVVRPANYFPVPFPSRIQAAKCFLAERGLPCGDSDARLFVNKNPENAILVSLYAITQQQPLAWLHCVTLLMSVTFCFYAPICIVQTLVTALVRPVVAAYGLEIAIANKRKQFGLYRELMPADFEDPAKETENAFCY